MWLEIIPPRLDIFTCMKVTDHAWAAGIIDGEGCITIKKQRGKYYHFQIIVGQSGDTLPVMLSKLQELYGGNIGNPYTDTRIRTPKWYWQVVCGTAEDALKKMLPYLVQKRDQALVALEYRASVGAPGKRKTSVQNQIAEHCYRKLREMKKYKRRT